MKKFLLMLFFCPVAGYGQIDPGPVIDSTTYDAFGIQIKNSDSTSVYIFREGYKHVGTNYGKIVGAEFNYNTKAWSSRWTIFDDPSFDDRNVAGGICSKGDQIVINFTQYEAISGMFHRVITIRSDDLNGRQGTWTETDTPFTNFSNKAAFSPSVPVLISLPLNSQIP